MRASGLETLAKTWPTPTAGDSKSGGSRNLENSKAHAGVSLTDMVLFGNSKTPRRHSPRAPKTETPGLESSQSDPTLLRRWPTPKAKLNPAFVDWMMGWPVGWTIARSGFDALGMASWRFRLRWLLSSLLGERG